MAWVVIDPSAPHLPYYAFFQLVLSGAKASKVRSFEGNPSGFRNIGFEKTNDIA